jgi:hypothetical protein
VESAEAFDGDDFPGLEKLTGFRNGIGTVHGFTGAFMEANGRPTIPAGVGLSMEPPIQRFFILITTSFTHGEGSHGGFIPIVGYILDDGVTGAAVGAIDKGIAVSSIPRIIHFPQAVITDVHIW